MRTINEKLIKLKYRILFIKKYERHMPGFERRLQRALDEEQHLLKLMRLKKILAKQKEPWEQ